MIGDDDVTRFVADQGERQRNRALPYYFMSFATAPVTEPRGAALDFYTTLDQTLFPFERTPEGRSYDGHAALAYDAAQVMIVAAAYLRETAAEIPVTPGAIWREITAIHTSRPDGKQVNKYLEGVTGIIDYGGDISRNVPQNKPVAVMGVVERRGRQVGARLLRRRQRPDVRHLVPARSVGLSQPKVQTSVLYAMPDVCYNLKQAHSPVTRSRSDRFIISLAPEGAP